MTTSDQMLEDPACSVSPPQEAETSALRGENTLRWLGQGLRAVLGFLLRPLELFRTYNLGSLRPDLIAGLTVAVVTLPQAMAYAFVAELPPEIGLYAAIIGSTVAALWGSSYHIQTGPTNTTSLLVLSALLAVASPGTPEYLAAAALMAIIVGVIQIGLGMARLGVMVNFISDAVIVGFTAGAGVLIGINQIRNLLRLPMSSMPSIWQTIPAIAANVPASHFASLAIGIGTIASLIIIPKISKKLPAPLLTLIAAALVVAIFGLDAKGVRVIGELPRGLPPLSSLPALDPDLIRSLVTTSLALGVIALVQTMSIARSISAQTGQRLDSNQEFFGQGLANIISGLFSGYTVAASFTASAVKREAGAKSSIASVFASIFLLLALIVFAPWAAYVPLPALAGVLIMTAYGLIDQQEINRIWRSSQGDRAIMLVTGVATLILSLEYAVMLGVGLSIITYLLRTSKPRVRVVLPSDDFRYFTPRPDRPSCTQLGVVEILGDLYFGAVSHIEEKIQENQNANPSQRYLLLRMYPVENCDISGIHTLESIVRSYRDRGGDIYFVHVQRQVRELMQSTGFYDYVGEDHFLDPDEAIPYLFHRILDPAICIYECPERVFRYCQNLPKRLDLVCPPSDVDLPLDEVPTLAPRRLWEALRGEFPPHVIDVREPREYRQAHIPEVEHLPYLDLIEDLDQVSPDVPVVLVCQGGRRSTRAAAMLIARGHTNVEVLEGGMTGWVRQRLLTAVALKR
ncbi:MAG: SulP family inorganic anion transporter [Anaerolineae bacterium]|nr:SulP family inorganic anion transporter [Anaerolineae bacterium]